MHFRIFTASVSSTSEPALSLICILSQALVMISC
jgi:hypothetical protein